MSTIMRKWHNLTHPVLGYVMMLHRVSEDHDDNRLVVTTNYLEKAVDQFLQKGYDFISIKEVSEHVANRYKKRFVCLTFDDGYLDTFVLAYPILKEKQVPFCLYATTDYYRGKKHPSWSGDIPMMTTEHLRQLATDPLCTIGVHTCSHPHLSELPVDEQRRELTDCKDDLEQLLGREVKHMAYPYGDYDKNTVQLARQLGFLTATTTSGRPVRTDTKLLELDRVTFTES